MRILLLLLLAVPAAAQSPEDKKVPLPGSIFQRLGITPAGQNGYEELILAREWASQSKLLDDAQQEGATLNIKRQALQDPAVLKALALMRAGLNKPVQSVYSKMEVS